MLELLWLKFGHSKLGHSKFWHSKFGHSKFGHSKFHLSIYLTPEQQRLVANSLNFCLSIARYQASKRPMPSRSLLSCSAQVVLGRPRGRFQPGPGALPQRAPIAVQSASWVGIPGCMRATCPKRASLLRLTLGSISSRRVWSFTSTFVARSNQRIPTMHRKLRL